MLFARVVVYGAASLLAAAFAIDWTRRLRWHIQARRERRRQHWQWQATARRNAALQALAAAQAAEPVEPTPEELDRLWHEVAALQIFTDLPRLYGPPETWPPDAER